MDFFLPYPPIRPSPSKPAAIKKTSKLALKVKLQDNESKKENRQLTQGRKILPPQSASQALRRKIDPLASLISSDESDSDNKQIFTDSTFHGSMFSLPKFESTRLESDRQNDTEQVSFFSCKSNLTKSLSASDTSDGACEDSIICISDAEINPPKLNTDLGKSHSAATRVCFAVDTGGRKSNTIILETSSEDENILSKHLTGRTVLSQLNKVSKKTTELEWRTKVISSSTSNSEDEVIESSYCGRHQPESNTRKTGACIPTAVETLNKNKSDNGRERDQFVIPESPDSVKQTEDLQDSREISPTAIIAEKLSNTKIADIERWLYRTRSSDDSDASSEAKNKPSPLPETPEKEHQAIGIVISETPSSDDSFDKILKRNVRKAPAKTPLKSSFINDGSSDSEGSFTHYRKDLVKIIKDDVNDVPKNPFGSLGNGEKKTSGVTRRAAAECFSRSESDSESDWEPGMSTVKKRGKPVNTVRRRPRPLAIVDSDSEPETAEHPTGRGKPTEEPKGPPVVPPKPGAEVKKGTFSTPKTSTKKGKVQDLKKEETPYSPIRTFLTSLSGPPKNPQMRSHPEASVYYKNYKSKKEELARRLFKLYNREVFDSRLPDDMLLEWNTRMPSTAGYCSCKLMRKPEGAVRTARIVLSTKILDSADRLRDTLIHELCHAAVWLLNNISGGHGPLWKAWASKAERRFPELPPIKRCHEYQIQTKFTYRCTDCGYRHSKSLDLKIKRCGHCYGVFEVLVNKQTRVSNGVAVSTPSTPRPPTGFALFVKENYASVKKDNQDKKHGDIMKLLSQKFAQVKFNQ